MTPSEPRRGTLAWALYDWANSAFATTVVAGFFPVFFKDWWSAGVPPEVSTFRLGVTVSAASLAVALIAPVLGALADQGGGVKRSLAACAATGIVLTGALALVPRGAWPVAAAVYALAFVAWLASCVFYDALIVGVSTPATVDRVSGLGFGLGYLGGGLLFAANVALTLAPQRFGLPDEAAAVRVSFVAVAAWWAVFSIPLLRRVPDPSRRAALPVREAARRGIAQLVATFREIRRYRAVFGFLVAYWLYIDGVDTVITMAVDYGKSIGFGTADLIGALLLVQFVAFPCAVAFGWAGQRLGPKRMILAGLAVYVLVTALAVRLDTVPYRVLGFELSQFYVLAVLVGTAQGGVQALSRSLFARIVPAENSAEFFGFYNMVGRFAAILGPLLVGVVGRVTGNPRAGIGSIVVLLLGGGLLLLRVRVPGAIPGADGGAPRPA